MSIQDSYSHQPNKHQILMKNTLTWNSGYNFTHLKPICKIKTHEKLSKFNNYPVLKITKKQKGVTQNRQKKRTTYRELQFFQHCQDQEQGSEPLCCQILRRTFQKRRFPSYYVLSGRQDNGDSFSASMDEQMVEFESDL